MQNKYLEWKNIGNVISNVNVCDSVLILNGRTGKTTQLQCSSKQAKASAKLGRMERKKPALRNSTLTNDL